MSDAVRRMMLLFSKKERKEMFEKMIKEKADATNSTVSGTTENALAEVFLPKNSQAAFLAEHYLYDEYWADPVRKTLSAIFDNASAGIYGRPAYDPATVKPFVEFAKKQELLQTFSFNPQNNDRFYLASKVDSITEFLDKKAQEETEISIENVYRKDEVKELKQELELIEDHLERFNPLVVYNVILNNWDDLSNLQVTYKALFALVKINDADMTRATGKDKISESRYELLGLLREHTNTWN